MTVPRPTRDAQATRQRLLKAALELYTSDGFLGTTTPAIAAHAGVAEGTIYRHFPGKEALFNAAYRHAQSWAASLLKELEAERTLKAPERLSRLAKRLLEGAATDPPVARMVLTPRDQRFLDDSSRKAALDFHQGLQHVVAMGKSDGQVRPGPAELWASVWLALIGFAGERISSGEWTPDHPQVSHVVEAAWDAIAARERVSGPLPTPAPPST